VKQLPWKRPRLSRPERVIVFAISAGDQGQEGRQEMRLLPDQVAFVRELYGRPAKRRVRLGIF
jgi:hypothetical protein